MMIDWWRRRYPKSEPVSISAPLIEAAILLGIKVPRMSEQGGLPVAEGFQLQAQIILELARRATKR